MDWLSATFKTATFQDVLDVLGLDESNFVRLFKTIKYKDYSVCYEFGAIQIFTEQRDKFGMLETDLSGCYLNLSGDGCRQLEKELISRGRTWQSFFRECFELEKWVGFFPTRIDLAIDDRNEKPYFTIEQLARKIEKEEYTSQSRNHHIHKSSFGESDHAWTVNIGKRKSDLFYRFYEKNKEQAEKDGLPLEHFGIWNRAEIEIRRKMAEALIHKVASQNLDLNNISFDLLNNKIRILNTDLNQVNKSRWKTWEPWERFIGDVNELKLTISRESNTLYETYEWFKTGGIIGTLKLFLFLKKYDALGEFESVEELLKDAKLSDSLMTKLITYLCEIDRKELLPLTQIHARNMAYKKREAHQEETNF